MWSFGLIEENMELADIHLPVTIDAKTTHVVITLIDIHLLLFSNLASLEKIPFKGY